MGEDNVFKLPSSIVTPPSEPSTSRDTTAHADKTQPLEEEYVNLLVTVQKSEIPKLNCINSFQLKSGTLDQMNENFEMYKKGALQIFKRRVSDVSSLSSYSSASAGYLGDVGSSCGTSTISGSSQETVKRDGLSLMPEHPIHPHNKIAPLPGTSYRRLKNPEVRTADENSQGEDATDLTKRTDENNVVQEDKHVNVELNGEENAEEERPDENVEVLPIKVRGNTAKKEKKFKTKGQRNLSLTRKRTKS